PVRDRSRHPAGASIRHPPRLRSGRCAERPRCDRVPARACNLACTEEAQVTLLLESRPLLDGFRRGDQAALLAVYRHYVRDVARFLTRGFSFSSDGKPCMFRGFAGGYEIEAALQEVFRRAFEERARLAYNGIDPYRPYLLRIARNAVINDLKSRHPILF